jgi:hypothetical protein|tara:strand:- start:1605 stop:2636 length:1032 start_codon:yes stop_codon:yes gene_type:complete
MKKFNSRNQLEEVKMDIHTHINPRQIHRIESQKSWEKETSDKTCCTHICEAIPLICKNFKLKMGDHLLLGGEHVLKVSPGYHSPMKMNDDEVTSEEKKEIVKASPSFGMFSLFRYHIKRGYMNKELKKTNKIYCSHIFSLLMGLPLLVFLGQWLLYMALVLHEINNFDGAICDNSSPFENKLMISGISLIYFARSFFIWDNITNSLSLKKMNRVNSIASILDTFQEFSFSLLVYGANIWVVFVEKDIQNMILNSLAMEFLMVLDNEFEELYFKFLPGAADDVYDNVFVSYDENKDLLEERLEKDKYFRCFSYCIFVPYKLLVITIFVFPAFCFFMIFAGAICK